MIGIVKESRLFGTLVSPSPLSLIFSCIFAALILMGASWSYVQTQPILGVYLGGNYGIGSLLHELNIALGAAFNSDLSYNIAVICFALIVGLAIYVVVESVRHMMTEARATLTEVEYASDRHAKGVLEKEIGVRLGLRAVSAFIWLWYAIFFFNGILPFCASFIAKGTMNAPALASVRNLLAFILLLGATHLHVLFIRLILLRPRVFGSGLAIGRGGHDLS
jgi:hypothetical protein